MLKEKIEAKINAHISGILEKDTISNDEYHVLIKHLEKLKADEMSKKWDDEKNERTEAFKNLMLGIMK